MKFKLCSIALLLGVGSISGIANASFISVGPASPVSWTIPQGNHSATITVNFTGYTGATVSNASEVFLSKNANSDISNQSAVGVATAMNTAFGLAVGTIHTYTSVATQANNQVDSLGGGSSATISPANPFNYLAVHAGNNELFFHWATAITSLNITTSGPGIGLSNYRAFNAVSAVPVPTAVWLFGSGLLGLIGAARRKSTSAI